MNNKLSSTTLLIAVTASLLVVFLGIQSGHYYVIAIVAFWILSTLLARQLLYYILQKYHL
jgi:hypothetical protein